ncbi:hypothetical protein L596_014231 [Steinernema carpocapsae]|uniref:Uncharacterized protein n=1 Tax=Steinernema carpocapsae TaxID=34508 RepID=A0A4U5NC47_STECR|nr:hypothetical protein L596_014231 [Steinernema carpocapsae]
MLVISASSVAQFFPGESRNPPGSNKQAPRGARESTSCGNNDRDHAAVVGRPISPSKDSANRIGTAIRRAE